MICAIIPAAGTGSRTGLNENKIFFKLDGIPLIKRTVDAFLKCDKIDGVCVVISQKDEEKIKSILGDGVIYTYGGATRGESVKNGLNAVKDKFDTVLIHDGARPFVDEAIINRVIEAISPGVGAVAGVAVTDTIKRIDENGFIAETPERSALFAAQTPQGFKTADLLEAYASAGERSFTDDAALFEAAGKKVKITEGSYSNKKVTTREDVMGETVFLSGIGYDAHRLTEGRRLILGGVEIPHTLGLDGHSDADVLIHAVMDALLGAAALGDIGGHFPDTDDKYKGISSMKLLSYVVELLHKNNFEIVNISAVITAQKPKLKDYIRQMNENIAVCCGITVGRVNVAATTTERLGFEGRCEGISSTATVMLKTKG